MERFNIGDTAVGLMAIPHGEPLTRRQRERAAVAEILAQLAPGHTLDHNQDGAPTLTPQGSSLMPNASCLKPHASSLMPDASSLKKPYVSITHSQKIAAVAINPHHVIGIDAEEWRPALERVKTRFLSAEELEWIISPEDLLRAWTVKEAVYKAAGIRLLTGPEIAIDPSWAFATAAGNDYSLITKILETTFFTLATRIYNPFLSL